MVNEKGLQASALVASISTTIVASVRNSVFPPISSNVLENSKKVTSVA